MPAFILAIIVLSGAAPAAYAEELREETVIIHGASAGERGMAIAPAQAPEEVVDSEPLVIAPKPQADTTAKPTAEPVIMMPEPDEIPDARPEPSIAPIPGPLETVVSSEVSDPNAGEPVIALETVRNDRPIGGERDGHGCLGPAGYLWDDEKQACVRPWSGEAQEPAPSAAPKSAQTIGLDSNLPESAQNSAQTAEASFKGPLEIAFDAIVGFFQSIFGWIA